MWDMNTSDWFGSGDSGSWYDGLGDWFDGSAGAGTQSEWDNFDNADFDSIGAGGISSNMGSAMGGFGGMMNDYASSGLMHGMLAGQPNTPNQMPNMPRMQSSSGMMNMGGQGANMNSPSPAVQQAYQNFMPSSTQGPRGVLEQLRGIM